MFAILSPALLVLHLVFKPFFNCDEVLNISKHRHSIYSLNKFSMLISNINVFTCHKQFSPSTYYGMHKDRSVKGGWKCEVLEFRSKFSVSSVCIPPSKTPQFFIFKSHFKCSNSKDVWLENKHVGATNGIIFPNSLIAGSSSFAKDFVYSFIFHLICFCLEQRNMSRCESHPALLRFFNPLLISTCWLRRCG